jgi:hypothetical protein
MICLVKREMNTIAVEDITPSNAHIPLAEVEGLINIAPARQLNLKMSLLLSMYVICVLRNDTITRPVTRYRGLCNPSPFFLVHLLPPRWHDLRRPSSSWSLTTAHPVPFVIHGQGDATAT